MRMQGIIRGRTIELDTAPNLPDGQVVQVDVLADSAGWPDTASQPDNLQEFDEGTRSDIVSAAGELRGRIAKRWLADPNLSVQYIREDRDR